MRWPREELEKAKTASANIHRWLHCWTQWRNGLDGLELG